MTPMAVDGIEVVLTPGPESQGESEASRAGRYANEMKSGIPGARMVRKYGKWLRSWGEDWAGQAEYLWGEISWILYHPTVMPLRSVLTHLYLELV